MVVSVVEVHYVDLLVLTGGSDSLPVLGKFDVQDRRRRTVGSILRGLAASKLPRSCLLPLLSNKHLARLGPNGRDEIALFERQTRDASNGLAYKPEVDKLVGRDIKA